VHGFDAAQTSSGFSVSAMELRSIGTSTEPGATPLTLTP
jgi:hypothetical protein